uniref:SEM1 26S proteasome complex subunit n=1 Tax=Gorilla gorilla gorilla TaxID=9595 RepID=A0A2I2Y7G4_GORGO
LYCQMQDSNICAVFAVQGGKVGRKHGIKRGRRPSIRSPAQWARGPWIHESKHPDFAKQQINLEMPNSRATTESLTLSTAPLNCSCLPGCHSGDLYNLAPAERTC